MIDEKLCQPEMDSFEMSIEACAGEEGLIENWRKGILGSENRIQRHTWWYGYSQCMLPELSSLKALISANSAWNLPASFSCILGSGRMPDLPLQCESYEYLNHEVNLTLNSFPEAVTFDVTFDDRKVVTFDVRNTLKIDFCSLSNSHYCQESPQWSSNIFSVLPICMTHRTLKSLLPFQKQSPKHMTCYPEISYRSNRLEWLWESADPDFLSSLSWVKNWVVG